MEKCKIKNALYLTIIKLNFCSRKGSHRYWEVAGGFRFGCCDEGEVLDDLLGVLRLAGSGLSGTQDTLVLTVYNTVQILDLKESRFKCVYLQKPAILWYGVNKLYLE